MTKYLGLILMLATLTARADIKPGTYKGVTANGEECFMQAGETTYLDGIHHPLTERFALEVEGTDFSAGHPSAVDVKDSSVTFNHDLVQAVIATAEGAKALVVTMVHTAQFEGPSEFTLIDDNWVKKTKVVKRCAELTYAGPLK